MGTRPGWGTAQPHAGRFLPGSGVHGGQWGSEQRRGTIQDRGGVASCTAAVGGDAVEPKGVWGQDLGPRAGSGALRGEVGGEEGEGGSGETQGFCRRRERSAGPGDPKMTPCEGVTLGQVTRHAGEGWGK